MYESFAHLYDRFMDHIPPEEWADYYEGLWKYFGAEPALLLDLACGTGSLTKELIERGYDVIGIDASAEMLSTAREKAENALFLCQDMRSFELYGTVDVIVCTCDSLNYLPDEAALLQVFQLAENYLNPGGFFLFDLNTPYKYARVLGESTFADTREDAAFICENYFYEAEKIHEYTVTFFERTGEGRAKEDERFRRFTEIHYQKAFELDRVRCLLERAHLHIEGVFEAFSWEEKSGAVRPKAADDRTERAVFAARAVRAKKTSSEERTKHQTGNEETR